MALITAQQVKTRTSIGGNVDTDRILHLIEDTEVMVLENVLGTKLYNKIVTDYNANNPNNLAGDYLELYNSYIVPILCFLTFADYLRDGVVLAQNTGVYTHQADGSTPANLDEIEYVAKRNHSKADVYIERMNKWLCDKDLTEYTDNQDNNYDQDPSQNIDTIGGWWFGSVPKKNRYGNVWKW